MSEHWAMTWTVKPGAEREVEELFRNYGTPEHVFRDDEGNEQGRLIATQVFMKDNMIVRVMEFEGDRRTLVQHLQRQPAVQALERLRPGFDMVSDLSGVTRLPPESTGQLRRIIEAARAKGYRRAVRVVGRSAVAAVQFERISRALSHEAYLAFSMEEAERLLDYGLPP